MLLDTHFLLFLYLINIFIHEMLFACLSGWLYHPQTHLLYCCISLKNHRDSFRSQFSEMCMLLWQRKAATLTRVYALLSTCLQLIKKKNWKNISTALFQSFIFFSRNYASKCLRLFKSSCLFHSDTHNNILKKVKNVTFT